MRIFTSIALILLTISGSAAPLSEKIVEKQMEAAPEAVYLDGMQGKRKWNYTTGLELKSFLDVYRRCEDKAILRYVKGWYDVMIGEGGAIYSYKKENYNLDHVCPGVALFDIYELTGDSKYRAAIETLRGQLRTQPRTPEGGFWHKKVYPQQMWLDGLYMGEVFYARYAVTFEKGKARADSFKDIVKQFTTVGEHCYDPVTGLYRHAWDSSRESSWCDPESGQSAHAWGRAMGWYAMALADVIEIMPAGTKGRAKLVKILQDILVQLPKYADPQTGMWYQVLDCPGREGNYTEATCSAMFAYTLLKADRLGILPKDAPDPVKTYEALLKTFVDEDLNLLRCCAVAGLGGKQNRSGKYDYYINETICANDPKGIGPLVWAALEYEAR